MNVSKQYFRSAVVTETHGEVRTRFEIQLPGLQYFHAKYTRMYLIEYFNDNMNVHIIFVTYPKLYDHLS